MPPRADSKQAPAESHRSALPPGQAGCMGAQTAGARRARGVQRIRWGSTSRGGVEHPVAANVLHEHAALWRQRTCLRRRGATVSWHATAVREEPLGVEEEPGRRRKGRGERAGRRAGIGPRPSLRESRKSPGPPAAPPNFRHALSLQPLQTF